MRALPVADPGTPDLRTPRAYLLWLMSTQKSSIALGIWWGCTWTVAQALVPAVIGAAIDALAARRSAAFSLDCAAVLGLGVLTAGTGILRHRCVVGNFLSAAYRTIQLVTEQCARLGHTLTRLLSAGEVISVSTADVEALGSAIDVTARGSGAVAALGTVAVILLARSPLLGLIVLIGGPALTALVALLVRPLHRRQQQYRDLQGELAGRAADIVSGLRVLRGIGGEAAFSDRYRRQSQQLRRTGIRVAGPESMLLASEVLVPGMFVTAATWIAAHYALRRAITPGELVSFYAYTSFLTLPLATLTEVADKVVRGLVAAGRVTAILALQPDVGEPACPQREPAPGAVLRDPVSGLLVSGGELVGVAADAAADGTELADRVGRYSGRAAAAAELGGVPLDQLPTEIVRRRVLVAAGDVHLFAGPVTEQLSGAGAGGAVTDRQVLDALATASGTDILDAIPGGLRGHLDSRGRSLSGGQRQRLGLARALLADPPILVLIEPTSAVDAHTEARIASGLRSARQGRTTLIVTTSPLLLDAMDRVVYLADGKVACQGTHRELLAASADYATAVARDENS